MADKKLLAGIVFGVLLIIGVSLYFYGPSALQSTVGDYADTGISCQQRSDCENYMKNQGASSADISGIDIKCEQTKCMVAQVTLAGFEPEGI